MAVKTSEEFGCTFSCKKGAIAFFCGLLTSAVMAETVLWTGGNGAWETPENWDSHAVPGGTADVRFESTPAPAVSISSDLATVSTLSVAGKGANFTLSDAAVLRTSGGLRNASSASYTGGRFSVGGDFAVGRSKSVWGDADNSSSVRTDIRNCQFDVVGQLLVSGYANNGLDIGSGATVTSAGYLDKGGTRNVTKIWGGGIYKSSGDIDIAACYPNESYPEPFTVDGGTVDNAGALKIASGNAGQVPVILRNGARWVQKGNVQVGNNTVDNSLQVCAESYFLAPDAEIVISPTTKGGNFVKVEDASMLEAKKVSIGGAARNCDSSLLVADHSSVTLAELCIGDHKENARQKLLVSGGSTFSADSMRVGYGESSDELDIRVANSTFTVKSNLPLPQRTSARRVAFTLVGSADSPATANFLGGLIIGAANVGDDASTPRTDPAVFTVDGGTVIAGGDVRLGALNVGGITDLAKNQLVIAGETGCFVSSSRMMAAGTPEIRFQVPEGGYRGEHECGLFGAQCFLKNAEVVVDVTRVKTEGTYSLAQAASALEITPEKISVVSRGNQKVSVDYVNKSGDRHLSVTVKKRTSFLIIIR